MDQGKEHEGLLHHKRAFHPEIDRDVLYRVDGEMIPLQNTGLIPGGGPSGECWEEAWLPEGSYWWLRLQYGEPTRIELIQWLPAGQGRRSRFVPIVFDGNEPADVLKVCERWMLVPAAIYREMGLEPPSGRA